MPVAQVGLGKGLVQLLVSGPHLLEAHDVGTGIGEPAQSPAPARRPDAVDVRRDDGQRHYVVLSWNSMPIHSSLSPAPRV